MPGASTTPSPAPLKPAMPMTTRIPAIQALGKFFGMSTEAGATARRPGPRRTVSRQATSLPPALRARSSKIPHRLRGHLPWPQIEEKRRNHQPDHGTPPNEVARIDPPDVQAVERKQRCHGEDDQTHNQSIDHRDVALRIAGSAKQDRADHEHKPTHLFQQEKEQSRDLGLGRVHEHADYKLPTAENHEQRANNKQYGENAQRYLQSTIGWL